MCRVGKEYPGKKHTLFPGWRWALCRVYWGSPCFQGDIIDNERTLPALGASLVYNFLLVATILPKYVSGCWTRAMMSRTSGKGCNSTRTEHAGPFYAILKWNRSAALRSCSQRWLDWNHTASPLLPPPLHVHAFHLTRHGCGKRAVNCYPWLSYGRYNAGQRCKMFFLQISHEPEGRSPPPSHRDNASLSAWVLKWSVWYLCTVERWWH